jgi:hypothetical protein
MTCDRLARSVSGRRKDCTTPLLKKTIHHKHNNPSRRGKSVFRQLKNCSNKANITTSYSSPLVRYRVVVSFHFLRHFVSFLFDIRSRREHRDGTLSSMHVERRRFNSYVQVISVITRAF